MPLSLQQKMKTRLARPARTPVVILTLSLLMTLAASLGLKFRPPFNGDAGGWMAWLILLAGVAVSLLLFALSNRQVRGRMRAERLAEELRSTENRFRTLFERSPDAIFLVDPTLGKEFPIIDCNEAACRQNGYTREELIGSSIAILDPAARDFGDPQRVVEALRSGPIVHRTVHQRKDGSRFRVEVVSTLIQVDGREILLGIDRDLTEADAAQAALRESQALFHSFMDHSPVLAYIVDAEGRILYANQPYVHFFGTSTDEIVGKTLPERFPRETAEELSALYKEAFTRATVTEAYPSVPTPDGRVHSLHLSLFPIKNAEGATLLGGMAIDITQRQQLEEQLRQAQKMDAIGKLAGGIAHDFNNMLAVIIGYCDILTTRLPPGDPTLEPLGEIRKAGTRSSELTRQLLAFSRQQVLAPVCLDLNTVVRGITTMIRRLIGEDIELTVLPASVPAWVVADPGQMDQVLLNLIVNARDAMPQGGKCTVEVTTVTLDDDYARDHHAVEPGEYVQLSVSDTGCGMDSATQARIFEPFFTTKEIGAGTGLGLATVYGIVKQSGGEIWVYSEVGHGTVFKVYLPYAGEAPGRASMQAAQSRSSENAATVLVVEDEEMVRQLIGDVLRTRGHTILEAADGEEALRVIREYHGVIDLLLTDVVIPKMSGRELAEHLAEERPATKVLFMSGYTDDAVVRHGVLNEGARFLCKPFLPADLAQKLDEVLSGG